MVIQKLWLSETGDMEGASRAAAYGRWNLCGDAGKKKAPQ